VDVEGHLVQEYASSSASGWADQILESAISLDEVEETLMRRAMEQANQNVSRAARILGLTRPALAYRLKKKTGIFF
jgi:DNA-binding protein Fis